MTAMKSDIYYDYYHHQIKGDCLWDEISSGAMCVNVVMYLTFYQIAYKDQHFCLLFLKNCN